MPKEKFKEINTRDVKTRDITKYDFRNWAAECAKGAAPRRSIMRWTPLREIIAIGIEQGARFDNPATHV